MAFAMMVLLLFPPRTIVIGPMKITPEALISLSAFSNFDLKLSRRSIVPSPDIVSPSPRACGEMLISIPPS